MPTAEPKPENCSTCRFWSAGQTCVRFPPVKLWREILASTPPTLDSGAWPRTAANDWCGEHQKKD